MNKPLNTENFTRNNTTLDGARWVQDKATANIYISAAISHMRNKRNIDMRTYFLTIHQQREFFSTYADVDVAISTRSFQITIFKAIKSFVHGNCKPELEDRMGIIFGPDQLGTKGSKKRDISFNTNETPHMHAVLILPFEISDPEVEEKFMSLLTQEIKHLYGVRTEPLRVGETFDGGLSVLVQKFSAKNPLWYLVNYTTKASEFQNSQADFEPYIAPYQMKLEEYDAAYARSALEKAKFMRCRATIMLPQEQTLRQLTYDPAPFYLSDVCRDISEEHFRFLVERRMCGTYDVEPSRGEINQIVSWGGAWPCRSNSSSEFLAKRSSPTWSRLSPALLSYLDSAARSVVLGFDPEYPPLDLGVDDEVSCFPSAFSWAKTYGEFHERLGYWRLYYHLFSDRRLLDREKFEG